MISRIPLVVVEHMICHHRVPLPLYFDDYRQAAYMEPQRSGVHNEHKPPPTATETDI